MDRQQWFLRNSFFPWYLDPYYSVDTAPLKSYTKDEWELKSKAKLSFNVDLTDGQIAWRRGKIKEKGNDLNNFLQEYPEDDQSCFIASGACPFDQLIVATLRGKAPEPILGEFEKTQNGWVGWKKFRNYDNSKRYSVGVDPAEGVGSDYSVIKILEAKTREECFAFRSNKIKPKDLADKAIEVATQYWTGGRPKPLIVVERNNHGHAVLLRLETEGYENLFFHDDEKAGWVQNKVTRPLMLDTFKELLEDGFLPIYDKHTLSECLTMIDNSGRWEHEDGKNDDCVFAHALALQGCIKEAALSLYDDIETKILI